MRRTLAVSAILLFCVTLACSAAQAQASAPGEQPSSSMAAKVRVYISDSQSWEMSGGWGAAGNSGGFGGGGHVSGGARPQTVEIYKTFGERCPELTATNAREKANYAVLLDHEGGKGALRRRNKIVVFNRAGDAIFSGSTMSLGNAVKDACAAIHKDHDAHENDPPPASVPSTLAAAPVAAPPAFDAEELATVTVTSNPEGADV